MSRLPAFSSDDRPYLIVTATPAANQKTDRGSPAAADPAMDSPTDPKIAAPRENDRDALRLRSVR